MGADTLADMRGMARVTLSGVTVSGSAHMQDLSDPAFFNRFHILIYSDDPSALSLLAARAVGPIRVTATSKGSMIIDAAQWGFLEFFPGDAAMRKGYHDVAPGSEVRTQWITVSRVADAIEVLIEEPR